MCQFLSHLLKLEEHTTVFGLADGNVHVKAVTIPVAFGFTLSGILKKKINIFLFSPE